MIYILNILEKRHWFLLAKIIKSFLLRLQGSRSLKVQKKGIMNCSWICMCVVLSWNSIMGWDVSGGKVQYCISVWILTFQILCCVYCWKISWVTLSTVSAAGNPIWFILEGGCGNTGRNLSKKVYSKDCKIPIHTLSTVKSY